MVAGSFTTLRADDIATIKGMLNRLIPEHAASFEPRKLSSSSDQFQLSSEGGKIIIAGNNANSMAVALNHYLKYYCNTNISWYVNDAIDMPKTLPMVPTMVQSKARVDKRFFLNYCTFGYTMPWWQWRDWEHCIDWMALNGVNLPLAITGQEAIWLKVWTKLGLSADEVRNYFTGPSHLPWHRMQNIDYWQGNLPMSWLDGQEELQKKIVAREREFNMKPVLPAFSGHVPAELSRIYPDAKITQLGAWAGYGYKYACSFLDPMDPLYLTVQKAFLEQQIEIYGTDHIYGIDVFNELEAPSYEPEYLARVSRQIYGSLKAVDKKATWLQMGWLFYNDRKDWTNERIEAYITAIPKSSHLLLDYYCENKEVWQQTDKFFGMSYIWCYLGNFGGNTALVGQIKNIHERFENAYTNGGKNMHGIGTTLEGFDCNPFIYNYIFEKAWDLDNHMSVGKWTESLADQRVGFEDDNARAAWARLIDSVYVGNSGPGQCSQFNFRPSLDVKLSYYGNIAIGYENKTLLRAIEQLFKVETESGAYAFDVVNTTRQLLGNYFVVPYESYKKAYADRDLKAMKRYEMEMLEIMYDVDRLVATQPAFLLGKWIADARAMGINDEEKMYYERNARNLLSTWGEHNALLNDYATRTWAGMMSTYYAERWKIFFAAVTSAVINNEPMDEERYDAYFADVTEYEHRWWSDCIGEFSSEAEGDGIAIARELFAKYHDRIADAE